MKIGLIGFDFSSPNKGCEALTYSFVNMLIECFGENLEIHNYSYNELGDFPKNYPNLQFKIRRPQLKKPLDWGKMVKEFRNLDCIFDVTFGDGFSDIYGKVWNATTNLTKSLAIHSKTPFVLLPQTYGPYDSKLLKKWAELIVRGSTLSYSRDIASAKEMNKTCSNKICILTDMAFSLPYKPDKYVFNNSLIRVGINISSLLWDSDYAEKNKFGLTVDYKKYITTLIKYLVERQIYEIHLIPHVIDKQNYDSSENDVRVCDSVKKELRNEMLKVAPAFDNPVDAKSYIANMNIFLGARMHSTIGALSAGIATIPFAYSKKFKSLFGNLGYHYVIEGRELNTEQALKQSIDWICDYEVLEKVAMISRNATEKKLNQLKNAIEGVVQR